MADSKKETIYIDVEDEITAIIDKVRSSDAKIVALVLPKRSQTLQSIVNLKLLKRTATQAKKNVALITSDPNLLPLIGAVGLHVAKTPQSKPEIPAVPKQSVDAQEAPVIVQSQTTSETNQAPLQTEDTIDLDNDAPKPAAKAAAGVIGKKLFNKKLKVPDFDRFRLFLFGGIGLVVLLIVGGIFAFVVLPKATITVKTDTANITTDLNLTAQTSAQSLDKEKLLVPAAKKELKKTETEKVAATGQRDDGTRATGTATLKLSDCSADEVTIPVGALISSGGNVFITQEAATLSSIKIAGVCRNNDFPNISTKSVDVTAQAAGDKYNLAARTYAVGGFSNVTAQGSNMSGGTTKLVQIVSQQDVNNAKDKVLERLDKTAKSELKSQFDGENMRALEDTYGASTPAVTSAPTVNEEATETTITIAITFTQLGVKNDDLKTLIEDSVSKNIDTSKQVIRDNGLSSATIRILDKKSADEARFSLSTISIAGPQLDTDGIKKEIAGTKKGATVKAIQSRPGIKDVEVDYSPFWVFSTPKRENRINITFDQSDAQ